MQEQIDKIPLVSRDPGKFEKDFGHIAEEMLCELLTEVPGVKKVELSSQYDDQMAEGKKIDIIITDQIDKMTAIQLTLSNDKEKRMKKINELKDHPIITELHDRQGNILLKNTVIPRAVVGCDLSEWGKAYNEAIGKGLNLKTGALANRNQVKINVVKNIISSLEFGKNYQKGYVKEFNNRIKFLNTSLKSLEASQ